MLYEGDRRAPIVVRLDDGLRNDADRLGDLPIPLPADRAETVRTVPLREVARITIEEGPNQINRENGKRRVVVTANVRGRDLGSFVTEVQRRVASEVDVLVTNVRPAAMARLGLDYEAVARVIEIEPAAMAAPPEALKPRRRGARAEG